MAQTASRLDTLKNLQTANVDVAFATAFGTLVGGTFLIGFVKELGGSDFWIQLVVALPSFMGLLQIPGAIWGRRFSGYKKFVAPGGWAWRLFYAPLIVLPLLPWAPETRLWILAVCIALATAATQTVGPIYNDWIAELVPSESRGWYFSRRTAISTAIAMGMAFVGGVMLDLLQRRGHSNAGFSLLFGIGFLCAMVSMVFFLRMKDTVRENPVQAGVRESLKLMVKPAKDGNFRKVLVFTIVFMVSATLAGGLYVAFARETLQLSYTAIQLTQVGHAVGTVLFANMWGYLADKYGNKPLLVLLMVGVLVTPVVWLLCVPGRPVFNTVTLVIGHVFNGMVWSGVAVTQMNLYIATSRDEDRANYLGLVFAVQAVVGGIAPMIGGAMMQQFRSTGMPVEHAYKAIFIAVMAVRVVAFVVLLPVREEGSAAVGQTLGQLGRVNPRGIRALRRLTRTGDPSTRASAIAAVGESQMPMAAGELLRALADPSPSVRRNAARALSRINDPETAVQIAAFARENRELVEEETLDALGDIGHPGAAAVVVTFLEDPRSTMRRQAARTLGRLGALESRVALETAASDQADIDLRRAAIQALRLLGAEESVAVIGRALHDPVPSVRTAAAEAVSELGLIKLADDVRASLKVYDDSYSSELAYALATVGDRRDVPVILDAARHAASVTTRRRCLMGLARLFGVETEFYRLLSLHGLSRDQALVNALKPAYQKSKRLRSAVQAYSLGDEDGALRLLASSRVAKDLAQFLDASVPDLFLIAALAYRAES